MSEEHKLITREEQKPENCWRMEDLFAADEDWETALAQLRTDIEKVKLLKGTAKQSPESLALVLEANDRVSQLFEKVYVYANQKYHQDTGNQIYQEMAGKSESLAVELSDALSFLEPEILELPKEQLLQWIETEELKKYQRYLQEELRLKEHILSEEMEGVLAKAQDMGNSPKQIFMAFNNADIDFGTIKDEAGNEVPLTHGNFTGFLMSKNREVRKAAFTTLYKVYQNHKNMLASTFVANLKQNRFFANMRHFDTTLEAALSGGNIPTEVYANLIDVVHENLPAMYKYVGLRKKLLGVDNLHMYDVYVSVAEQPEKVIPFAQAKEMVLEGLALLGEDYGALLREGYDNGWIDVYENKGKRSGAYSWGAFGTHPYVLLNYAYNLNSVFTLAHEMGHAIHSYHSDHAQPYVYAGYRIFVAEVASTCNEALLIHDLMKKAADPAEKMYLINYFLDQFKGTLYRQTMFAEFEWKAHQKLAEEGSMAAQTICDMYYELNQKYFGPEMVSDEEIAMEWSRIPHFYTPFYVYQYATGFAAAIAISSKILKGEEGIVEKYKEFLSGGCSKDPIDLLKICGVDMTRKESVQEALDVFAQYVDELEKLAN